MELADLIVQHGTVTRLEGPVHRHGDVRFLRADADVASVTCSSAYPLLAFAKGKRSKLPASVRRQDDAPWILGRLMALFEVEVVPEQERGEKSCFSETFVAILPGDVAIPFECSDRYCRSDLYLSDDIPPETRALIARSWWGLLLSQIRDVRDYSDWLCHIGAGFWIQFGIRKGRVFIREYEHRPGEEPSQCGPDRLNAPLPIDTRLAAEFSSTESISCAELPEIVSDPTSPPSSDSDAKLATGWLGGGAHDPVPGLNFTFTADTASETGNPPVPHR